MRHAQQPLMPDLSPLNMDPQDFAVFPETGRHVRQPSVTDRLWRFAVFAPAVFLTGSLVLGITRWFGSGGVTVLECVVIGLVGLTFIWVSLSVITALLGLLRMLLPSPPTLGHRGDRQRVALLVPVYNEVPWDVFGNAAAMLQELDKQPDEDQFDLFILSDTQDRKIADQEYRAVCELRMTAPAQVRVYYRRRLKNTDKKVGNVSDWVRGWGGAYDAMIVLDADSLMSGSAICEMADAMARDPKVGLIQTFPTLIGARTLFGRMQQFSSEVYGPLLAEGLAAWSQNEGNYWGHNAIIRTRAFAQSAHLPYVKGMKGRRSLVLSHDFVEAGMLRRAGWAIRFLPNIAESFEQTPETLIDYALRDRRWCQGNLQHLRILSARGFHPVSRFHLLQGAVAFLLSPAWFALILIWSFIPQMPIGQVEYFSLSNPLQPMWPIVSEISGFAFLAIIYAMLLFPKFLGVLVCGMRPEIRASYGGLMQFWATALFEVICSILFAPVLMVQQTLSVFRALLGRSNEWSPQRRNAVGYTWSEMFRFHWTETLVGFLMTTGIILGGLSLWLLPVALSLLGAVILSKLSGVKVAGRGLRPLRLDSPNFLIEPEIVRLARSERVAIKASLLSDVPQVVAAE